MRQIIRRREVVADDACYADEEIAPGTRLVPPAAQFLADVTAGKPPGNAVLISPEADVSQFAGHLARLSLIVLDFPKIGEGRGFSQARLLRQRYGYRGELRARGALKRDQIFLLARCGVDSFHLEPSENLQAAIAGLDSFSVAYQDGSEQLIHVERRSAGSAGTV